MRIGGMLFGRYEDPDLWVADARRLGYEAVFLPFKESLGHRAGEFADAAGAAGLTLAEVGAWSNPLSPDPETRRAAIALCQARLALADEVGARCCVNIAGSRGREWDGWHPLNFAGETLDLIVQATREIIDQVRPTRTFFTLEPSVWIAPDSADSYEELLAAVDRERFAVHFDPVNIISSPRRYAANGRVIREFLDRLGPRVRSVHAKDIRMYGKDTVHFDELRPGQGGLDYPELIRCLKRLDPDLTLMIEHVRNEIEAAEALGFLKSVRAAAE